MLITKVDVYPFKNAGEGTGTGVAYVTAVLDEDLVLKKMTLHRFNDGAFGLFPPGVKKAKAEGAEGKDEWDDFYFFMKPELRDWLFSAAVDAYKAKVA